MATKRFLAFIAAILITFFMTFFVGRVFVLEQGAPPGPVRVAERADVPTGIRTARLESAT
jgi:hypothetical protein